MSKRKNGKTPRKPMLDKPGIAFPEAGPVSSFCFYAVMLFLAGTAAMGCFFTAFQLFIDFLPVLFMGAACALLCSAQFQLGRWRWLAVLVPLLIWGTALWWNFEDAAQGCFRTVNVMLAAYGEKLTFSFPVIPTVFAGPAKSRRLVTLFAVFLQLPFYELLSWLFIRHKSALGAFCLTGIFLLFPLAISSVPEFWALGLLLLFWSFLLFAAPLLRHHRQPVNSQGRLQTMGDAFTQSSALLLLPVIALCMLVIYRACPPETYERPKIASDIRTELTEGVDLPAVFRGGTGSGGNRVDLSALGSRTYTGKTALRVKHEWQDPLVTRSGSPTANKDYLKNFVGSVYTGTSWERLSREDAAEGQSALEDFHAQTLPADLSQAYYSNADIHSAYLLSVEKMDTDTRGVYSPYGLYAPKGAPSGMEYVDDGYVKSSGIFSGLREYTLSGVALPSSGAVMGSRFWQAAGALTVDPAAVGEPSEELLNLLDQLSEDLAQYLSDNQGEPAALDLWTVPDWAKEAFPSPETDWSLLEATERYTAFVHDRYTQLPDSTRAFLEEYMDRNGLLHWRTDPDFLYYGDPEEFEELLGSVRDFLASQCSYTLSPPTLPGGEDFVEYFLTESHEGYCVHFASAAVAMLRVLGIPARYAEGYAVPVSENGEWVNVPDYNAHAWVEVYWGGTGWLPVEMTPAGPDAPAAYANAATPGAADLHSPTPSASPAPEHAESSSAPSSAPSPIPTAAPTPGGSAPSSAPVQEAAGEGAGVVLLRVLLVLFIAALLLFLLWAQRAVRIGCRERSFRQQDRNQAALRVYAHLLRLYQEKLALSDRAKPPADIEELALKARFSNHTLTQEELQKLTSLADELEKELEKELPRWARLRCKYLLALF